MQTKTINITIPHRLSRDEARTRIQNTLAGLKTQHAARLAQVDERWTGDHMDFRLAVMGQAVTGRVDVRESVVDLAIDLPWILAMFAEKVRGEVQREGTKLLEKK
ncbi:MAG TPA: polyhydroxyalkanoic acid system family protein [Tepidisphaeraceae bacterium]|nr:polyhydroxyalkanoic acid system family protein [Tepidisphaeraceae bacterium]